MEPVNADDLEWSETNEPGTRFRRKQIGGAAGAEELGVSLYELPAGERGWPLHYHTGNEEGFYVLAGEGRVRTGPEGEVSHPVEPGDYVACPPDECGAHQLVNTGEEPLRFLAVSTMNEPDVAVYPESDSVGIFVDTPPGGDGDRPVSGFFPLDEAVDYWELNAPAGGDAPDGQRDESEE
jgi:uncharacterized cupin superfamily protein